MRARHEVRGPLRHYTLVYVLALPGLAALGYESGVRLWIAIATAGVLGLGVCALFWRRRNPLMVLTEFEIEVPRPWGEATRIPYGSITGWILTTQVLCVETLDGKRHVVWVQGVGEADRQSIRTALPEAAVELALSRNLRALQVMQPAIPVVPVLCAVIAIFLLFRH